MSAGRLLREAREKQGLHIAALAAAIKVTPKKLELLESDRFDALPDATFTRALAQTVCRALKTDPTPVMRLLPPPSGHRLENVGEGLNTPFRERPGCWCKATGGRASNRAMVCRVAGSRRRGVLLPPADGTRAALDPRRRRAAKVEPGMPPDVGAARRQAARRRRPRASTPAATGLLSCRRWPAGRGPATPLAVGRSRRSRPHRFAGRRRGVGRVQLRTTAASWVEVTDGRGQSLVSRVLKPGEAIGVEGVPPLKVRIGNAAGTQLVFRGQPTDLKAFTRDNVARLELR
jgi:cytoskeleton protein RodZ